MQNDILFDNIYVGHSIEDAENLKALTFDIKHPIEKLEAAEAAPPEPEKPKSPSDLKFLDDPVHYVKEKVELFLTIAKNDPIMAIKFVPEVAGGAFAILFTIVAIVIGSLVATGGSAPEVKKATEKVKEAATDVKGKAAEAKKEAPEATKRTSKKAD
jgi:calnexin